MAGDAAHNSTSPFIKAPWGKHSGRSMFGKQADSKKANAPAYSIMGSRAAREKVFISQSHVEVDRKCTAGPGHIYDVPGALDKQPEARKETAPKYTFPRTQRLKDHPNTTPGPGVYTAPSALGEQPLSPNRSPARVPFGSSSREDAKKLYVSSRHMGAQRGTQGPPPGTYTVPGSFGQQVASAKPTSPAFTLRKTDRLKEEYDQLSRSMPAAGQYETWASIGKQTLSVSRTMPAYGFGGSTREQEYNRFITSGHAKIKAGTFSPNNYNHQTADRMTTFGKQPLSRITSTPSYGFGSTPKLTFKMSTTPGPGQYEN